MNETVALREYSEKSIPQINANDVEYLKASFLSKKSNSFKVHWSQKGEVKLENTSFAGVIQLEDVRIHFSTKVKANLFYMLSFLKSEDNFIYDPLKAIEIEEGGSFFDILGKLFYNELSELINQGLLKKYIKREENVKFLKGKLLFNQQISQNLLFKPNFYCRYHDLTYDNLENQILLRATNLLIPMIRFNEKLRYSLLRLERDLKQEVSFNTCLSQKDCDLICYDRLNEHYHSIIDFSKLIFEEHFIRSVHKGKSTGFNFIVNMPQVYEDFLTEMIVEVIQEDCIFSDYSVASQLAFDSLVKEKKIITRPDIILQSKDGRHPLIIDAKYKRQESNADFYQMIAYSLAIKDSEKCCLIYPRSDDNGDNEYTVVRDVLDDKSSTVKLFTRTIGLFDIENEEFDTFIERVKKDDIRPLLIDLLGIEEHL
jgi:5-methylcytosine-specific restriction enzyme subunit McrC